MLSALCGSKSAAKALLFLFVNGRGYGSQLHRHLKTPLTPLQKAFSRLEKGGIVTSCFEGKRKIYQLNSAFTLYQELEPLLKRAYTLLPTKEKRDYYAGISSGSRSLSQQRSGRLLLNLWKRLSQVTTLQFYAKSSAVSRRGSGVVFVAKQGDYQLIFTERGSWKDAAGKEVGFSNVYRWSLDMLSGLLSLEHLRQGIDKPVFLFHIAPSGKNSFTSVDSHLCAEDIYFGEIKAERFGLRLHFRLIGPNKNDEMEYHYS